MRSDNYLPGKFIQNHLRYQPQTYRNFPLYNCILEESSG